VPSRHSPVEVRVSGREGHIESPVPVLVVQEDGSEVELPAGIHEVTVR
jgi:hypothetical protein